MRPTMQEMLAGIEGTQSSVLMPRIMATGEMDALWEAGFAYRLLGYLREHGDALLEAVRLENLEIRELVEDIAAACRHRAADPDGSQASERLAAWARSLPPAEGHPEAAGPMTRIDAENADLKRCLDDLVRLLDDLERSAVDPLHAPELGTWRARIRATLRRCVERHAASSEVLLKSWQG